MEQAYKNHNQSNITLVQHKGLSTNETTYHCDLDQPNVYWPYPVTSARPEQEISQLSTLRLHQIPIPVLSTNKKCCFNLILVIPLSCYWMLNITYEYHRMKIEI